MNPFLKLREIRQQNHLTCQQVADQVGITRQYYWYLENGYRNLSYDLACKIASVFKTTPDYIFWPDKLTQCLHTEENN